MSENQKALADATKIMVKLTQKNNSLEQENRKLREQIAKWKNTFLALCEYHFSEGGTAPNLPVDQITLTTAPNDIPYEVINNGEFITIVSRRRKVLW